MKRQKSKSKTPPGKKAAPVVDDAEMKVPRMSRRDLLDNLKIYGVIGALIGAGGWYLVDDVMAKSSELDLTKIGNGIPTVVQIHDPECPRCRALQREARAAMASFDSDELQYVVANIRHSSGRQLADEHGVGHVTLLLFDGTGMRRNILVGENSSDTLTAAFQRHLDRYGPSS